MGLSASQARLLSLTSRLSDLELRAQNISNCKIRLADQAEQASQSYSDALDKQTLKVYSGLQNDGTASYVDATAKNLTTYGAISNIDKQRFIKDPAGRVLVSSAVASAFTASGNNSEVFLNNLGCSQFPTAERKTALKTSTTSALSSDITSILSTISKGVNTTYETNIVPVTTSVLDSATKSSLDSISANVTTSQANQSQLSQTLNANSLNAPSSANLSALINSTYDGLNTLYTNTADTTKKAAIKTELDKAQAAKTALASNDIAAATSAINSVDINALRSSLATTTTTPSHTEDQLDPATDTALGDCYDYRLFARSTYAQYLTEGDMSMLETARQSVGYIVTTLTNLLSEPFDSSQKQAIQAVIDQAAAAEVSMEDTAHGAAKESMPLIIAIDVNSLTTALAHPVTIPGSTTTTLDPTTASALNGIETKKNVAVQTGSLSTLIGSVYSELNALYTSTSDPTKKAAIKAQMDLAQSGQAAVVGGDTATATNALNSLNVASLYDTLKTTTTTNQSVTTPIYTDEYSSTLSPAQMSTKLSGVNSDLAAISSSFTNSGLQSYVSGKQGSISALIGQLGGATIPSALVKSIQDTLSGISINDVSSLIDSGSLTQDYKYDPGMANFNLNLFNQMKDNGFVIISDENMNSSDWLQSQIDAGNIYLHEYDQSAGSKGTGDYVNVSWTSGDATLSEVTNDRDTAKAEAVYETTMASIQSKDKRFDVQLSSIDTEHTAVQTEVESVKKVITKNIERSLKMFDA